MRLPNPKTDGCRKLPGMDWMPMQVGLPNWDLFWEEVNIVRICPVDPEADYRMENDLTSYVLNGFCTRVDEEHEDHDDEDHDDEDHDDEDHDHEDHDHEDHDHEDLPLAGAYANLHKLKSTTTTVLLFEAAPEAHGDHVDSWDWFEHEHVEEGTVYDIISAEGRDRTTQGFRQLSLRRRTRRFDRRCDDCTVGQGGNRRGELCPAAIESGILGQGIRVCGVFSSNLV